MPLFYCKVLRVRISYTINNSLPRQCLLPLEVADDCPQCGICLCVPVPLVIVAFIWIICCGNNCSWPVSSRANPKKDEYCDFFVLVSRIFGIFNHWKLEGKYSLYSTFCPFYLLSLLPFVHSTFCRSTLCPFYLMSFYLKSFYLLSFYLLSMCRKNLYKR